MAQILNLEYFYVNVSYNFMILRWQAFKYMETAKRMVDLTEPYDDHMHPEIDAVLAWEIVGVEFVVHCHALFHGTVCI